MGIAEHREYFARRQAESARLAETTRDPALAHLYRQFASQYMKALAEEELQRSGWANADKFRADRDHRRVVS